MKGFKSFTESGVQLDQDYWTRRLAQFQAATDGQKGVIAPEPEARPRTYQSPIKPGSGAYPRPVIPAEHKLTKTLTPDEVRQLKLHKNHQLVWQGSTADAPANYPYVYAKRTDKFLTNPAYVG